MLVRWRHWFDCRYRRNVRAWSLPRLDCARGRRLGDVIGVGTHARVNRDRETPTHDRHRHRKAAYPRMTAVKHTTESTFAKLGVRDEIVRALGEEGIKRPFAIQELTLPLALDGEDVIGQARTGMGKTFAFGVPLLQRITSGDGTRPLTGAPRALVVVPTRELCLQVTDDLATAGKYLTAGPDTDDAAAVRRRLSVVSIYGGRP